MSAFLASWLMAERQSDVQDGAKRGVIMGFTISPVGSMERM